MAMIVKKTVAMTTGKKIGRRGGERSADGVTRPGWHPAANAVHDGGLETGHACCCYAQ
jgi:hypothetical protein